MTTLDDVLADVTAEVHRAHALHGEDSMLNATGLRLPILVEEVGEVATAMLNGDDEQLATELIQVAAMAVTWLCGNRGVSL